ncbi:chaperone modulator CbpM [Oleidesulfovibrio sp.]|uniref:chaperone modulator CbpM n=1 Tax=Oleidesulfovibrio sp. TaxID=2909707 RepID=UPI003A883876
MSVERQSRDLPIRSEYIAWAEFIELTGIHPGRLGELVEYGWLVPVRTAGKGYLFSRVDVYRLRKLQRICDDFDLPSVGGVIIVDLLERIDHLERKVRTLEKLI